MFRGQPIPLRVFVGGIFVIVTLAIGFSMAGLFYTRMKSAISTTSTELFDRTANLVSSELQGERLVIATALAFATRSELARAPNLAARLNDVQVLVEELGASTWIVAAYAGYPNGDFIELRRRPADGQVFGRVPQATHFVLMSIERRAGAPPGRTLVFFDRQLRRIGSRDDRRYAFDPRTRPWFAASARQTLVTAPYQFFVTHEVGITAALRSVYGSVFGVDIDLASASADLAGLRPTPSSEIAIAGPRGEVIAYSDPAAFARVGRTLDSDRVPTVVELGSAPIIAGFTPAAANGMNAAGRFRDASGRLWLYQTRPILADPTTRRGVVLAVPEDELFSAADRARREALVLGLGLVLFWIPLTLWVSRFIARPLSLLRTEAVALRNRDFSDRIATPSIITEIHEFAATFASMREHIRDHNMAATRFIPEEFLRLLDRQDIVSLELGDHVLRNMTILFSDIRSFTSLSESMSPQQTFNFVNSYLTRVGPIIRDHHGFIDKYIGDAIMGLFPQQPLDAIDGAIAMQRRVVVYNDERARAGYAPIAIGIGLHSGDLMLGTIGETRRFETTVIADAVNVASRLESLTKTFGSLILSSGQVIDQVDASTYLTRRLGDVQVVGTTRPVTVIEICDADPPERLAHKQRTAEAFERARIAYAAGDFVGAHRVFETIAADDSADKAAAYFRDRSAAMAVVNLQAWDGVEKMESK